MLRTIANAVKLYLTQYLKAGVGKCRVARSYQEWNVRGTPGRMGGRQSTVMLRATDIDWARMSEVKAWCRMARMEVSKWCSDRGPSKMRVG